MIAPGAGGLIAAQLEEGEGGGGGGEGEDESAAWADSQGRRRRLPPRLTASPSAVRCTNSGGIPHCNPSSRPGRPDRPRPWGQ